MNYVVSITDFFKSPKWMMNLLLAGICCLVPVLGWIVVTGWLVTGFWMREDKKPETFPDFNFDLLGKYFERGLWPAVVTLAISFGSSIALQIFSGIVLGVVHMILGKSGFIVSLFAGVIGSVILVVKVALFFITIPVVIRATILQDFVKAFDIPFIKKFISLLWLETLLSVITLVVAFLVLVPVGMIVFCIGVIFSAAVLSFAASHLNRQLYDLYLSRGGEAIPLSPKLSELPPTPPAAAA